MEEYIHNIGTVEEFTGKYYGAFYHEPWVSLTIEDGGVNYNRRAAGRALRMDTLSAGTQAGVQTNMAKTPEERDRIFRYLEGISGGITIDENGLVSPVLP